MTSKHSDKRNQFPSHAAQITPTVFQHIQCIHFRKLNLRCSFSNFTNRLAVEVEVRQSNLIDILADIAYIVWMYQIQLTLLHH